MAEGIDGPTYWWISGKPGDIWPGGSKMTPCRCGAASTCVVLCSHMIENVRYTGTWWLPTCDACASDVSLIEKMGEMVDG